MNENLELLNNTATSYIYDEENNPGKGAGIHFCFNDQMTLENGSSIEVAVNGVSITGNTISGEGGLGGGIYFENTSLASHEYTFQINLNYGTISGNSSTSKGGGIYVYKETVEANAVDENGTVTLTVTNEPALASEDGKATPAKVYAKDNVLYCQFADVANRQLQVYNVAGNLCKNIRLTSESESLSLEGMVKGVYIYRVMEAGKKTESGKFLVK